LDSRIKEFAAAIRKQGSSVLPRIRKASEELVRQRTKAIESTLQLKAEGKREQVQRYLSEMLQLTANFAADPASIAVSIATKGQRKNGQSTQSQADGILQEQHYQIADGSTGYTYERVFRPYIDTAEIIRVEDPYIRSVHQVENFTRFCALAVGLGKVQSIELVSGATFGENTDDADSRLETLLRDLAVRGIRFSYRRDEKLHDREIRFDNGWIIKIGRGLDIYHKPDSWVSVEAHDFSLRRCRATKVDVFREQSNRDGAPLSASRSKKVNRETNRR
jgi:hypothetical protein